MSRSQLFSNPVVRAQHCLHLLSRFREHLLSRNIGLFSYTLLQSTSADFKLTGFPKKVPLVVVHVELFGEVVGVKEALDEGHEVVTGQARVHTLLFSLCVGQTFSQVTLKIKSLNRVILYAEIS